MSTSPCERGWLGMSRGFWHVLACIALVGLTAGVFSNALCNEFIDYDDWYLVERNPRIRSLSPSNLLAIFVYRSAEGTWLPVRVLSYAVD